MVLSVIGGGLAGCEAAWQAAQRGVHVHLYEMRPITMTAVHRTGGMAELVCSNSLGTVDPGKAPGLLKEELRLLGSLILDAACKSRVPAGQALAVDRDLFSAFVEARITGHPLISVFRQEVTTLPAEGITIVATGPMTSAELSQGIRNLTGDEYLYFYDAVSPIVSAETLDMSTIFRASRYGKGDQEYLNCPLDESQYGKFVQQLIRAECAEIRDFEKKFFEGCLPVEEIASRGPETLRFGPMKPVGLVNGAGVQPYAVVQLRQENHEATMYNLVGFQTRLKWSEQKRVFSMIPGLENAEFLRYGVMHRNVFINSPRWLNKKGQFRGGETLFFAGQLTGVEGYLESTISGALCGINGALCAAGKSPLEFPPATAIGSLMRHITEAPVDDFQPMNINFGLFPPLKERIKKKAERNKMMKERALKDLVEFLNRLHSEMPLSGSRET